MKTIKKYLTISIILTILIIFMLIFVLKQNKIKFDINQSIVKYNIQDEENKNRYLNYLKNEITPKGLEKFIDNDFIYLDDFNDKANGHSVVGVMKVEGYSNLFNSMFDKNRANFDDCPVTSGFKEKFKENLLKYFNLIESNDSIGICMFDYDEKEIELNVYSNFENTEPTSVNTYHFHYTLDSEGNVDDVIIDDIN